MNSGISFLSPRLVGKRFEGHAIPLELLKDFTVLEEMIVEVAKWHYLQDHSDRKRSPRGFTKGISLQLAGVSEGSAVAKILLCTATSTGLFPDTNQEYFEKARDSIVSAINAAESGGDISSHLEDSHLSYFDRIGRSLLSGESIEFDPTNPGRPARLNKETRRTLTLASKGIRELTEEVSLRGKIPEADHIRNQFELELPSGRTIKAPLELQHRDTVLSAFSRYPEGIKVLIEGIAKFDRNNQLKRIDTIEHVMILDPLDIVAQLDDFRELKDGWLDGKGLALSENGIDWLAGQFESLFSTDLPMPYLYPTPEGGVLAEWSLAEQDFSLEISLEGKCADWHVCDVTSGIENGEPIEALDLKQQESWQFITKKLGAIKDDICE